MRGVPLHLYCIGERSTYNRFSILRRDNSLNLRNRTLEKFRCLLELSDKHKPIRGLDAPIEAMGTTLESSFQNLINARHQTLLIYGIRTDAWCANSPRMRRKCLQPIQWRRSEVIARGEAPDFDINAVIKKRLLQNEPEKNYDLPAIHLLHRKLVPNIYERKARSIEVKSTYYALCSLPTNKFLHFEFKSECDVVCVGILV